MQNPEERRARLKQRAQWGDCPIDLDFLRELGFEIGLDWDGQLLLDVPTELSSELFRELLLLFEKGIRRHLQREGENAQRVLLGGPLNGKRHEGWRPGQCLYFHTGHKQWHVYQVKSFDDPRAWYVGTATSKPKAKSLAR